MNVYDVIAMNVMRLYFCWFQSKALKQYEKDHKNIDGLTDEDKFLLQLTKVERLQQKLNIMHYMSTFQETVSTISPVSALSNTCRDYIG